MGITTPNPASADAQYVTEMSRTAGSLPVVRRRPYRLRRLVSSRSLVNTRPGSRQLFPVFLNCFVDREGAWPRRRSSPRLVSAFWAVMIWRRIGVKRRTGMIVDWAAGDSPLFIVRTRFGRKKGRGVLEAIQDPVLQVFMRSVGKTPIPKWRPVDAAMQCIGIIQPGYIITGVLDSIHARPVISNEGQLVADRSVVIGEVKARK